MVTERHKAPRLFPEGPTGGMQMSSTTRLPGGIISVAVCVILLMAIVIPVTYDMAGTLESASGSNGISSADKAVYTESETIVLDYQASTYMITIGGQTFSTSTVIHIYSPSVVLTLHSAGVRYMDSSSNGNLGYPVTIKVGASGLTVTDGQSLTYPSAKWIMYTHLSNAGYPAATHGYTSLPVLVGPDQVMVHYALVNNSVSLMGFYDHGQARGLLGTQYTVSKETVDVDGAQVTRVTEIANGGTPYEQWYAPLTWEVEGDEIVHLLVAIAPVILAAALITALAWWIFPDQREGRRKDDVFTSR